MKTLNFPNTRTEIVEALKDFEPGTVVRSDEHGRISVVVRGFTRNFPPTVFYRCGRVGEESREFSTLNECFQHLGIPE